ncbi:Pentatricopeptide repeat-containing protein, partial [Durusdinium trenchii]
ACVSIFRQTWWKAMAAMASFLWMFFLWQSGLGTLVAGKSTKRRGDEGRSGQRCPICQKLAVEAGDIWRQAKTTKPGSPYHYIGAGSQGQAPEKKVLEVLARKVCNRNALTQLPNPKGYTLHHPTLQFECDDVLETFGESLVDALTLGEDLATFCWEVDICGSSDVKFFDFEPEDDDDPEEEEVKVAKKEL